MPQYFYLQDSRSYVGNCMSFWRLGGGYTTDITAAQVYTLAEAQAQHDCRDTDIPWPVEYIAERYRLTIDHQTVDRKKALKKTGVVLAKPKKYREPPFNCRGCGRFLSWMQRVSSGCPGCHSNENSP